VFLTYCGSQTNITSEQTDSNTNNILVVDVICHFKSDRLEQKLGRYGQFTLANLTTMLTASIGVNQLLCFI
jgi:hypothetical protein